MSPSRSRPPTRPLPPPVPGLDELDESEVFDDPGPTRMAQSRQVLPRVSVPEVDSSQVYDDPGPTRMAASKQVLPKVSVPEVDASQVYDDPGPTRHVGIPMTTEPMGVNPLKRRSTALPKPTISRPSVPKAAPAKPAPKKALPQLTAARPTRGGMVEVTGKTRALPERKVLEEIESSRAPRPAPTGSGRRLRPRKK
jgi:hypothetical protein